MRACESARRTHGLRMTRPLPIRVLGRVGRAVFRFVGEAGRGIDYLFAGAALGGKSGASYDASAARPEFRDALSDLIARSADRLLTLFPFEPPLYKEAGIEVTFVGHPLAADAANASTRREARELLKLEVSRPVFALLPGSRRSELEMHTELLLRTAAEIFESQPATRFVVPLISRETREYFEGVQYRVKLEALPLKLLYGHADHALRAADVAIVASGTATLEAVMARCPHLVFYRVNPITAVIVARKRGLPLRLVHRGL